MTTTSVDIITQEIIRARLDGIVREMQAAVLRTGYSTIIRESHDFSAGIVDREGERRGAVLAAAATSRRLPRVRHRPSSPL